MLRYFSSQETNPHPSPIMSNALDASLVPAGNGPLALSRNVSLFVLANLLFGVALSLFVLLGDSSASQPTLYLVFLFFLCTTPLLFIDCVNGRYSILVVFTPVYFIFYGLTDLLSYMQEFRVAGNARPEEYLTSGEVAILLGGVCLIGGYILAVSALPATLVGRIRKDWPLATVVMLGVLCWIAGIWATWIWQLNFSDTRVRVAQDSTVGTVLTLLRMLQPIGSTLLAYAYLNSGKKVILCLLLVCMIVEVPFGLIADSKELAIRTTVIFVFSKWLFDGNVPLRWIVICLIAIVGIFPIFQSYRYEVLQTRSNSREKAVQNFSRSIETALDSRAFGREHGLVKGVRGFSGRINLKANMERIVRDTGRVAPFQNGYTISLIVYALVPRFILPDKPDSSVGQLFNRQFRVSLDPNTYISATHMGELFWNFGWPGLIMGMCVIGSVMGTLSCIAGMAEQKSVTRLLLLMTTIYLLCLRFEGGIALQYTLWLRSLTMIALLHFMFRRRADVSI